MNHVLMFILSFFAGCRRMKEEKLFDLPSSTCLIEGGENHFFLFVADHVSLFLKSFLVI